MAYPYQLFLWLGLWMLALPVTAAVTANCASTDPANFDQVYACMASFRRGDRSAFANIHVQDCRSIGMKYLSALVASGLSREEAYRRLPSCALFARAVKDLAGQDAYWSGCIGFGSLPTQAHLARCLDRFIPGFYGVGQSTRRMQGCGDVFGAYEKGLRASDSDYALPEGYTRPDCTVAADYLAAARQAQSPATTRITPGQQADSGPRPERPQWAQCLNYDPANLPTHLRACLNIGPQARRLKDCRDVQDAYTARLKQAYGGLPENFLVLPCPMADGYLAEIRAEEEAEKKDALERQKEANRVQRAALIKRIEALRDNPPSRPFYAQPWVTWLILLLIFGTLGRWLGRWLRNRGGAGPSSA